MITCEIGFNSRTNPDLVEALLPAEREGVHKDHLGLVSL
jgi:hypothetical protein